MFSPVRKRPCSGLSLRARRSNASAGDGPEASDRGLLEIAAEPEAALPAGNSGSGAEEKSGQESGSRRWSKLSRRYRKAAPAPELEPGSEAGRLSGAGAAAPAEASGRGDEAPEPAEGEERFPLPYYLRNFLMVLEAVLGSEDKELFNDGDELWLRTFGKLSVAGQKLYVRLFQRKLNWLKITKLNYPEIGLDLTPSIEELRLAGLLQTGSELCDVSEALDLLSAPELKLLAKSFHLRPQGQRAEILKSLLRLAKQQSIFSCNQNPSSPGLAILNRTKELLGHCVRVAAPARAVFSRVLLLFNLTEWTDEEEAAAAGQSQLSTVVIANMGHVTFPSYTVLREKKIFRHRDDLLRYVEAIYSLAEVLTAMTRGTWSDALQIYKTAREKWIQLENSNDIRFHQELPVYLRCFTVGWVYTRIRFRGVEILQRLHMYEEAVEELKSLLEQSIYCPESRGRWWNRLSLNLHQHLKQTEQVMIKGRTCPGMGNSLFLMENTSEGPNLGQGEPCSTVICSVEEVSLAHYRQQGFDQGIHGEGAIFLTLFGLFFWDIIFLSGIPDVFRNPYQACPLDLYTDCFYQHRREPIESRVEFLQDAPIETLHRLMADVWNNHRNTTATLINWEIFSSLQQAQSLVSCLGGLFLSGICSILAKNLRHCRGGLPDLVVWNSHSLQYKLSEVKGPTDQLSHKQMVWLDQLRRLGADVEVCHVSAVGARSHQLSSCQ
ncbi:fanconi-associated nuclease 1 isoform X2 [Carcharodon carcharias]|uniref:fanconi-associated nuclease 1 isoform X2 n=1 Tax=Carcharodon carcharias TaxID=13397 RepID=UPI001B7DF76E|nr:fanconi-associated nuclease 1 isoform X2 [Carcharodon carcharias]